MNDKGQKREEDALRIMQALSAVDEELLIRSGDVTGEKDASCPAQNQRGKIYRFVMQNRGIFAACLCLTVLAGAFWVSQTRFKDSEVQRNSTAEGGYGAGNAIAGMMADQAADKMDAEEELQYTDTAKCDMVENAESGYEGLVGNGENTAQKDRSQEEETKLQAGDVTESAVTDKAEAIKKYVSAGLPEGYEFVEETTGDELILRWWDGEHFLSLKILQIQSVPEAEDAGGWVLEDGTVVYPAYSDWTEVFWKPDDEGRVQFGLVDEEGVLIEYSGYLEKEEVIYLFGEWTEAE